MNKAKVLIADDNEDLLASLRIQLLVYGYEVVTCTNAELAVAYAQKHRPDVMVVDIWMDGNRRLVLDESGNGLGLPERLKKLAETRDIPVIYITGNDSLQLDLRAKQVGAFGLIHKPVNFSALLEMIEAAIKSTRKPSEASPREEDNRVFTIADESNLLKPSKR